MSREQRDLTTTSYALLGLLAIRPWTTYGLAKQMRRGLGLMWPRARSKIYEEPKNLVAHGLARASVESVGRRSRTVYMITPKGRRALAAWLAIPGDAPTLEYEQLVKVFFADHGSKQDVLNQLSAARAWADEETARHLVVGRSYLEGHGSFQERAAALVLTGRFLADFANMVGCWAEWGMEVVSEWPDDPRSAEPHWSSLEETVERAEAWRREILTRVRDSAS